MGPRRADAPCCRAGGAGALVSIGGAAAGGPSRPPIAQRHRGPRERCGDSAFNYAPFFDGLLSPNDASNARRYSVVGVAGTQGLDQLFAALHGGRLLFACGGTDGGGERRHYPRREPSADLLFSPHREGKDIASTLNNLLKLSGSSLPLDPGRFASIKLLLLAGALRGLPRRRTPPRTATSLTRRSSRTTPRWTPSSRCLGPSSWMRRVTTPSTTGSPTSGSASFAASPRAKAASPTCPTTTARPRLS